MELKKIIRSKGGWIGGVAGLISFFILGATVDYSSPSIIRTIVSWINKPLQLLFNTSDLMGYFPIVIIWYILLGFIIGYFIEKLLRKYNIILKNTGR